MHRLNCAVAGRRLRIFRWLWLAGLAVRLASAAAPSGGGQAARAVDLHILLPRPPLPAAGEIGFVEDYAFAPDRAAVLNLLVPGSDEYRYYEILTLLHRGQVEEADRRLGDWPDRGVADGGQLRDRAARRLAIAWHGKNPAEAFARLRLFIHPRTDYEPRVPSAPDYPSVLPPERVSRAAWRRDALNNIGRSAEGNRLEPAGYEALEAGELAGLLDAMPADRAANLLDHVLNVAAWHDLPDLVALIARRLNDEKRPAAFGTSPAHQALTLNQLLELGRLCPPLASNEAWVDAVLARMVPSADVDADRDDDAWRASWDERWTFAQTLPAAMNVRKAALLTERLARDRARGVFDPARFAAYLQIPRTADYANPDWLKRSFSTGSQRPPRINLDDGAWVKAYALELFTRGEPMERYAEWIADRPLKQWYAEAMLTSGRDDPERWFRLYDDPAAVARLRDRVDLDFDPANPERFGPSDPVALLVHVKNVKTLTVKAFEVNLLNWYRRRGEPVTTAIDLDGLVANDARVFALDDPPFARVARTFEFPAPDKPGIHVIEVIGGGRASRAVIRRGALRFLERPTAAGHAFTLLDADNRPAQNPAVWLGNQRHAPDAQGEIIVPFGPPGRVAVILQDGDFAELSHFERRAEEYKLSAGFALDREMLLARRMARMVIRPKLTVAGAPAPLALLTDVELHLQTRDRDPLAGPVPEASRAPLRPGAALTVRGVALAEDAETVHEFTVPEDLAELTVRLTAKIRNITNQRDDVLSAEMTFPVNGIDRTEGFESLHFSRDAQGYYVDVLGKTGEPSAGREANLRFKHREFSIERAVRLRTDAAGRIRLGELPGIVRVEARLDGDRRGESGEAARGRVVGRWPILPDAETFLPEEVHAARGRLIQLPYGGTRAACDRLAASLVELRGGLPARDCSEQMVLEDGFVRIGGLAPGDYRLRFKENDGRVLTIRIADAPESDGYAPGRDRLLELSDPEPLHIVSAGLEDEAAGGALVVRLAGFGAATRAHVVARRYQPDETSGDTWDAPGALAGARHDFTPIWLKTPAPASVYLGGRDIGDEYRYILERQRAPRYAGAILDRPGLLLQPWMLRDTATTAQAARAGEDPRSIVLDSLSGAAPLAADEAGRPSSNRGYGQREVGRRSAADPNLDWLASTSAVLTNLKPDENGFIRVARADLRGRRDILVLALDIDAAVARRIALAPAVSGPDAGDPPPLDLRLANGLDPAGHFARRKQIVPLVPGTPFVLADARTDRAEIYDSLADAHRLFQTLSSDADWTEFAFLLRWPAMAEEEKDALYAKYACHELNFFLHRKDAPFFERVVKPYLANKKDKTFLDQYLIGDDLSGWLELARFERLNPAERLLLSGRVKDPAAAAALRRGVREAAALIPPNRDAWNRRFDVAIRRSALDAGESFALEEERTGRLDVALSAGAAEGDVEDWLETSPKKERRVDDAVSVPTYAPSAPSAAGVFAASPVPRESALPSAPASLLGRPPGGGRRVGVQADASLSDLALPSLPSAGKAALGRTVRGREMLQLHFRQVDAAKEWTEHNYWHDRNPQPLAARLSPNAFWRDYADHLEAAAADPAASAPRPFVSANFAECADSFTGMVFALALLDLPFESPARAFALEGAGRSFVPAGPGLAFHESITSVEPAAAPAPLLLAQNYFRLDDRHRFDADGVRREKFIVGEFLANVAYGAKIAVTNPTDEPRRVSLLLQIPAGALPLANGFQTRVVDLSLEPYQTQTREYAFYFPNACQASHYPVHVESNGELLAFAPAAAYPVVDAPTTVDGESWEFISQRGTTEQLHAYLRRENLGRIDLSAIAWRMRDPEVFRATTALLRARHVYDPTLWGYALFHAPGSPGFDETALREFLEHDPFAETVGAYLESPLLTVDPVERGTYRHLEYAPLVHARAHALGSRRQIANDALFAQYARFLDLLAHKPALSDEDRLAAAYYLLLQDRFEEGAEHFARVGRDRIAEKIQYDYMKAWLALRVGDADAAGLIARAQADVPSLRWRRLFSQLADQLAQVSGAAPGITDADSREQALDALADAAPSLEMEIENGAVEFRYRKLDRVTVNYYRMDLELLFSRNPFSREFSDRFGLVAPNRAEIVRLPEGGVHRFAVPEALRKENLLVEAVADDAGLRRAKPYFADAPAIRLVERYGQLRAARAADGQPLAGAYVKVYARGRDGTVAFYKDGYTDLRGVFDYATLSAGGLDAVERFALLVLSDDAGAALLEAEPPAR